MSATIQQGIGSRMEHQQEQQLLRAANDNDEATKNLLETAKRKFSRKGRQDRLHRLQSTKQ
jgi:hypothetical protein